MAQVVPVQKPNNSGLYSLAGTIGGAMLGGPGGAAIGGALGGAAAGGGGAQPSPIPNAQLDTAKGVPQQTAENPAQNAEAIVRELQRRQSLMQQQQTNPNY